MKKKKKGSRTNEENNGSRRNADEERSERKRGYIGGTAKGRDGGSCHVAGTMNLNEAKRRDEAVKRGHLAETCKVSIYKQGN